MRGEVLWTPPADVRSHSRIGAFLDWLGAEQGMQFDGYADLWQWSVDDLDGFWTVLAEWSGVRWHDQPTCALAEPAMPGARWFPGATLNYAEHALAAVGHRGGETAVVAH